MGERTGYVAWSELMTRDTKAACDYYAETCGWTFDTMKMDGGQDYFIAMQDGKGVAGIMDIAGIPNYEDTPAHWFTYLGVSDVDAQVAKTSQMGGTVLRPPFDVPGIGRIAIVMDPGGAAFGFITEADGPS
ncbi:VOC family protein [Marivita sp. S6314]|uniref:VOC family protein n=1 Tax=Marivita sp. S6314 TaxID=2926406 RepID=UPI001FF47841|nr:VOC family protein [Marivita sp. S6314]MCK0150632.1 VOC family protein [Marivita sp. S6314]